MLDRREESRVASGPYAETRRLESHPDTPTEQDRLAVGGVALEPYVRLIVPSVGAHTCEHDHSAPR